MTSKEMTQTGIDPAYIDGRNGKPRQVSRKVQHAVGLILSGEVTTIKAAAVRVGLSREHLTHSLHKPHVRAFIARERSKCLAEGAMRAARRLVELLDSGSSRVDLDASKALLQIDGVKIDSPHVAVNVDIRAGYVIDLSAGINRAAQREPAALEGDSVHDADRRLAGPTAEALDPPRR